MAPFVNMGSARFDVGGWRGDVKAQIQSQAEMELFDKIANKISKNLNRGCYTLYKGKRFADLPRSSDAIDAFDHSTQIHVVGMMSAIEQIMSGQAVFYL